MTIKATRISLGGTPVNLLEFEDAVGYITARASAADRAPLAVASINLDHIHHFGTGSRWTGTLETPGAGGDAGPRTIEWLNLVDGAPLASQARRLTGHAWPRLAGSDLIGPIMARAERDGNSIGFLGGTESTHEQLRVRLSREYPTLRVSGFWAPSREDLVDPERSNALARGVAASQTDILVVALGKPRQELWIAEYGTTTEARVLLAFGAVVDFLAGRINRAPKSVASHGLEWAWRLALEPRRLARRYLIQGPPAMLRVRLVKSEVGLEQGGVLLDAVDHPRPSAVGEALIAGAPTRIATKSVRFAPTGTRFVGAGRHADVAVIVVTYNNAQHLGRLLASLHEESADVRLRVIFADNGSTDGTLSLLASETDIVTVETGGNRGYAGGINAARSQVGDADAVLVLNPDVVVSRGAVQHMLNRMIMSGAGAVVPQLLNADGTTYRSLRREPTLARAAGDALFGRRNDRRPGWLSEIDFDTESYHHAHRVDWATGAALLVRRDVADAVGDWDERFFLYSEETDYCRRVRATGATIWYESGARIRHDQGGSGFSPELAALLAVNRVRYTRKHHSPAYAAAFHAAVVLHEALRSSDPAHRATLRMVLDTASWLRLPRATLRARGVPSSRPIGSIVIPANNEASVIERTLRPLLLLVESGEAEVIVVCNGCTDGTADLARRFHGVQVLEIDEASKPAALNKGDTVATAWPRLYIDADIEISAEAVRDVFDALAAGGVLAVRPAAVYNSVGAGRIVHSYYRARSRIPSLRSGLWGAGAYALSRSGHARLGAFPMVIGDDFWVDQLFSAAEKAVVDTAPVVVRTPRNARALLGTLRRAHRGVAQASLAGATVTSSTRRTLLGVARSIRGPWSAADAAVYGALSIGGRFSADRTGHSPLWERDHSSRNDVAATTAHEWRTVIAILTHNNEDDLSRLVDSIRLCTTVSTPRVIVIDAASTDDTVARARSMPDMTVIETGGDLSYSGAINVARRHLAADEALAVLSPDLVFSPGSLESLQRALDDPGVGIAVPVLRDADGIVCPHLQREPSIVGSLGDALLGAHWVGRPRWTSDTLRRAADYSTAHDIAWAGGALLIAPDCNARLGEWKSDASILYIEETDYARRARDAGYRIRFVPGADTTHTGDRPEQSGALLALIAVNRVRYYESHHARALSALFRGVVVLHHFLRAGDPRHRYAARTVCSRSTWNQLPPGEGAGVIGGFHTAARRLALVVPR